MFISNGPLNTTDFLGLLKRRQDPETGKWIYTVQACEIVFFDDHGCESADSFTIEFEKDKNGKNVSTAFACFRGCYAGDYNAKIPKDNLIPGAPNWKHVIDQREDEYRNARRDIILGILERYGDLCQSCKCESVTVHILAPRSPKRSRWRQRGHEKVKLKCGEDSRQDALDRLKKEGEAPGDLEIPERGCGLHPERGWHCDVRPW